MHDELGRLDEDLAAGRLDADSYRRLRDELLAARPPEPLRPPSPPADDRNGSRPDGSPHAGSRPDVSDRPRADGPHGPGGVAAGSTGTDEVDRPAPTPGIAGRPGPAAAPATEVRDPFPPPFRWNGAGDPGGIAGSHENGSGAVADATQVVAARPGPAAGDTPERTQVVRGAAEGAAPPGDADATQVVGRPRARIPDPRRDPPRTGPLAAPAPPERTQFVPGAALTRAGDLRSVPARRTIPPWVDERSAAPLDARRPGREVFARGRGPRPAAVIGTVSLVLVVLVVLALSFLLS